MIETTLLNGQKEFNYIKRTYYKDTDYHKYLVGKPSKFPCIALEVTEASGDLGSLTMIDHFIYLSDFGVKDKK